MRTPVTTKDSAAATVQRSTSTVRIDLGKVLFDRWSAIGMQQ
jgi:hypothetical protein